MEKTQEHDSQNALIDMLNDDCLKYIFQYLSILEKVRIERVCKRWRILSRDSWCTMKRLNVLTCPTFLDLPSDRITEFMLRKISLRCGKFLNQLHMPSSKTHLYNEINTKVFSIMTRYCPNLIDINISGLKINALNKRLLMKRCTKITKLTLGQYFHNLDNSKTFFQNYPKLNYLQIIFNYDFTGKCLSYLPAKKMRTLIIKCCNNISDVQFSMALAKLENLEYLGIFHSPIGNRTMEVITKYCKNLKKLEIHNNFKQHVDMSQFTNIINLQVLKMTRFLLSRTDLISIAMSCQQITYLDISGGNFVNDAVVSNIATLPKLEYLNISFAGEISDNGLRNIKNLKGLACCGYSNITDNGICKILVFSPQLQILNLSFCRGITINTYEAAKKIADSRPNKMILKIYIWGTRIFLTDRHKTHPMLKPIIDLSDDFFASWKQIKY